MSLTASSRIPEPINPAVRPSRGRARRTEELVEALIACETDTDRGLLRDELVQINVPVAHSIAGRYRSRGIAIEDLEQVACLALVKAAGRFDPSSGHAFLSFTVPTIRGEVRRYFRDQGWMVRPPRRVQELQTNALRALADLSAELGRTATPAELAHHMGESLADVREAMDGRGCFTPTSLDHGVGESGDSTLGDLIGSDDTSHQAAEARVALAPVIRHLGPRDRRILELRFIDDLTQREIAQEIGVTQMQVSRLLSRIYRDLRSELGELDEEVPTASSD